LQARWSVNMTRTNRPTCKQIDAFETNFDNDIYRYFGTNSAMFFLGFLY
jgi:hypothetical protein